MRPRISIVAALFCAALGLHAPVARGAARLVTVGSEAAALRSAVPGDTLVLEPGRHAGPLRIDRQITLRGMPGAVLDGGGRGTVLEIAASGVTVEDLAVRGSGTRVLTADAAIRIYGSARVSLRRLRLLDTLYGVYAERSDDLLVERCDLTGRADPATGRGDGNGLHFWACERPRVSETTVERFVDGIYLSFTHHAVIDRDRLEQNSRYGLHTMYCQENRLTRTRYARNIAGCAIMFSNHLVVEGNEFIHNRGPRTYGLLLRDCSDGAFRDNQLVDNTIAIFMDGSNRNVFEENLVQDNGWGILLFSSSDGNAFARNSFLNNDYPVALDMRYTDNRFDDGARGNYWSENAPYDLDADGVSDIPYSPVSAFAFLSKQYPDLSVLARSPAVAALAVAERVIPALRPSEAIDRFPLLRPRRARITAGPDEAPKRRPAWISAAAFMALAALGTGGVAWGRGRS